MLFTTIAPSQNIQADDNVRALPDYLLYRPVYLKKIDDKYSYLRIYNLCCNS